MKSLSCRDAGFDCDYILEAENDDELFRKGEQHVFNEKMRSFIRQT